MKNKLRKGVRPLRKIAVLAAVGIMACGGISIATDNQPQAAAHPAIPTSSELKLPTIELPTAPALPKLPPIQLPNGQKIDIPGSSAGKRLSRPAHKRRNNAKPAPKIGPGAATNVYTRSTGRNRRYIMHIPTGYRPGHPTPVLFGFDGWRDSPENFRRYSRLHESGAAHEAIRIYPESINHGWEGAPYAQVRRGEDTRFVLQILDELERTYSIDRNRIYATGHSNGGGMTAAVACQLPHVFAGVAAVGGAYYDPVNSGCRPEAIPFLIMHGTGDTMMRFNGGVRHRVHYQSIRQMLASYMRRNGCANPPKIVPIPGGKRHLYRCSRKELQLITNPQNHTWNWQPDATQEVWNFLRRQHR